MAESAAAVENRGGSKHSHQIDYATVADMCGSSGNKTLGRARWPQSVLILVFLEQFVPRDLLFRYLGKLDQEVDDLVLEQGRT